MSDPHSRPKPLVISPDTLARMHPGDSPFTQALQQLGPQSQPHVARAISHALKEEAQREAVPDSYQQLAKRLPTRRDPREPRLVVPTQDSISALLAWGEKKGKPSSKPVVQEDFSPAPYDATADTTLSPQLRAMAIVQAWYDNPQQQQHLIAMSATKSKTKETPEAALDAVERRIINEEAFARRIVQVHEMAQKFSQHLAPGGLLQR